MTPHERPALSRAAIVDTAITYVDEHGLPALTMRRLGELLGVEAMSLYHYVNGREDLLEAVVARLVEQVEVPTHSSIGPADGWQAFLQHVAHEVRAIALAHPMLFPLVATRPPAAPWLRPPLRNLGLVEAFLEGLLSRGMSEEQATRAYKMFTSFLLGHLLLDSAQKGASTGPASEPLDEGGAPVPNRDQRLSLDDYPAVRRLGPRLQQHDATHEFEQALEMLLDRLDTELSQ